jgi:anti-anti-sigma regulatory factor
MVRFASIGPAVVAHIVGECNVYSGHDIKSLRDSARGAVGFVVSLAECPYFHSGLVTLFFNLSNSLGKRFAIASPNAPCRRRLQLVGVDPTVAIFDSVEEAAAYVLSRPAEKKTLPFTLQTSGADSRSRRPISIAGENQLTPSLYAQASDVSRTMAPFGYAIPDLYPDDIAQSTPVVAPQLEAQVRTHRDEREGRPRYLTPTARPKLTKLSGPSDLSQYATLSFSSWSEVAQRQGTVGGDWCSVNVLDAERAFVSIGDVTGHGVTAGIRMRHLRQALFRLAADGATPEEILSEANRSLSLDETIATAIVGVITLRTREIRFASAGHCQPILCNAGGIVRKVGRPGPPLGADLHARFHECFVVPKPGSRVILYTDGLLEFDRDLFLGEERIVRVASELRAETGPDIAQRLAARVLNGANHPDDIAVLTISF